MQYKIACWYLRNAVKLKYRYSFLKPKDRLYHVPPSLTSAPPLASLDKGPKRAYMDGVAFDMYVGSLCDFKPRFHVLDKK